MMSSVSLSSRARRRCRAIALVVVLACIVAPVHVAQAQDDTGAPSPEPAAASPLGALDAARAMLPERVRGVGATSAAVRAAELRITSLEATIVANRTIRDESNAQLVELAVQRQAQRDRIDAERARRQEAGVRVVRHRNDLEVLAVEAYVGGGPDDDTFPLDVTATNDVGRQRVIVDVVDATVRERLADAEADRDDATAQVTAALAALDVVIAEIEATTRRRDAAEAELARAEPELPRAQEDFRDAFLVATLDGSDMSVVAYDAYASAAAGQGACGLTWTVLAGIGRTESRHGTYGGARPNSDGTTSPRIIGIALDGRPGIATIRDTDGGAYDGDTTYDRAVGPMQFIPGTWRSMARDGNGDGRADPHNLYDATAAAAAYLCRLGGGLGNPSNLNRAILSYNQSQVYVDTVLGYRRGYDRLGLSG
jgi:membrane-bound lytic murein transglycosylase B